MKETRLHVRIDTRLKEEAEQLAERKQVTLSALITRLLREAVEADRILQRANPGADDVEQV